MTAQMTRESGGPHLPRSVPRCRRPRTASRTRTCSAGTSCDCTARARIRHHQHEGNQPLHKIRPPTCTPHRGVCVDIRSNHGEWGCGGLGNTRGEGFAPYPPTLLDRGLALGALLGERPDGLLARPLVTPHPRRVLTTPVKYSVHSVMTRRDENLRKEREGCLSGMRAGSSLLKESLASTPSQQDRGWRSLL
jgi:hypothetical protein